MLRTFPFPLLAKALSSVDGWSGVTEGEVTLASIINLIFENHQGHGDASSLSRP